MRVASAGRPIRPPRIETGGGKHSWTIGTSPDSVPLARHTALTDDGHHAATAPVLASRRAEGCAVWGVLRGDVDNFGIRMRRLQSIEEHVQLSVLYKQFFAGEVEVLCSLPEFWRKVNLLHTGGDDFAVYGAWDALIAFARELQRLFQRFTEEHLKDFPGRGRQDHHHGAGACAGARHARSARCTSGPRDRLEIAKSADKDCFYLLGRTLEWKQLADAAELKDELTAMVRRVRHCATIHAGSVRHLSRNQARARREAGGAALAFPSPLVSHPGKFARARFSKGARQPDRRPGGKESRESEIAAVRTRSARMGQTVH